MRKSLASVALSAALLAMPGQAIAQKAEKCVTAQEAEALMLTFLPDVIETLSSTCKPSLPATARLSNADDAIANVYRPASEAAAADGTAAFARLMGGSEAPVEPALLKALTPMMVSAALGAEVKPSDCADIEDIYSALEPLPPQNMAQLLVALVKLGSKGQKSGKADQFICPTAN